MNNHTYRNDSHRPPSSNQGAVTTICHGSMRGSIRTTLHTSGTADRKSVRINERYTAKHAHLHATETNHCSCGLDPICT